jgi:hypothetical protein
MRTTWRPYKSQAKTALVKFKCPHLLAVGHICVGVSGCAVFPGQGQREIGGFIHLRAVQPVPSPVDAFPFIHRFLDELIDFSVRVGCSSTAVACLRIQLLLDELMDCFVWIALCEKAAVALQSRVSRNPEFRVQGLGFRVWDESREHRD